MIASQHLFYKQQLDGNTFILSRKNYLEICSMVLAKTNTMHAWLLLATENR
jgi:hypothetical protein